MAAGMFVLGCFGPLIAVYVRDSLHASTRAFGVVAAMIGLGMLIGINGLNTFGKHLSNTLQVYSGLCGIGSGGDIAAGPRLCRNQAGVRTRALSGRCPRGAAFHHSEVPQLAGL